MRVTIAHITITMKFSERIAGRNCIFASRPNQLYKAPVMSKNNNVMSMNIIAANANLIFLNIVSIASNYVYMHSNRL